MSMFSLLRGRRKVEPPEVPWQRTVNQPVAVMIEGRRHIANLPYLLPKDAQEMNRLDLQHHFLHAVTGKHVFAPLPDYMPSILDVGCGTGRWAQEMARLHPHAQVVGLDVEPLVSSTLPIPENYRFVQGNVLDHLPFPPNSFAYVHQRLLVAAIPARRWQSVVQELVRVTASGGFVELVESSNRYPHAGPLMQRFLAWSRSVCLQTGIQAEIVQHLDPFLRKCKLQQIVTQTLQVPLGTWGGRLGEMLATDMLSALMALRGLYTSKATVTPEEFDAVVQGLPEEWNQYHTEFCWYIAYGQKP